MWSCVSFSVGRSQAVVLVPEPRRKPGWFKPRPGEPPFASAVFSFRTEQPHAQHTWWDRYCWNVGEFKDALDEICQPEMGKRESERERDEKTKLLTPNRGLKTREEEERD